MEALHAVRAQHEAAERKLGDAQAALDARLDAVEEVVQVRACTYPTVGAYDEDCSSRFALCLSRQL